jgi:hypothetical protein
MENYKIEANEIFFKNIIKSLNEGGLYAFPDAMEVYKKEGEFLVGSEVALSKIKDIVSEDFYNKYFKLQKLN